MSLFLCIHAGGKTITMAAGVFTLSWTHSVEKTQWQERWAATAQGLAIREARVKGSGAGMEPGENARREGDWLVWTPKMAPLPELVLASSGTTNSGWTLCGAGGCHELGRVRRDPIILRPCQRP